VEVGVLGPAEACRDAGPVDLGPRKQRALLCALALHRARAVPVDTLVDLLWGDAPPPGVVGTLQGYVAGLRRALEPERRARTAATVVVTHDDGYALALPDRALDVGRFEALAGAAHRRLASVRLPSATDLSPDDLEAAAAGLDEALALWRGTPFAELDDAPAAVAGRARLEELRLLALEDRAVARLGLGRHAQVAAELEALTAEHPMRERLWALRCLALAGSGRQAEALEVLRTVREVLADELGIEPGPELQELQAAVLRQDPALTRPPVRRSAPPAAPGVAPEPAPSPAAPWPMVGRDRQLADLVDLLDHAEAGSPAFAAVVGEPGIGKSRLCAELAAVARNRGVAVAVGRCSQDEGAPPLWPWRSVLAAVGAELPTDVGAEDEGTRFRSWDLVVDLVRRAAHEQPVLVVLDDLHWSDVSSLRVLGLLLEGLQDGRLLVVCTWRDDPPPGAALAAVAEGLARRHALRLRLTGLPEDDVATIVEAVAEQPPTADEAAALRRRTDGNPFFLVEFARLAQGEGALSDLLTEPDPPAAVNDVLVRRLDRLPQDSARLLQAAAVLGRDFDLATLAATAERDEDAVLDLLDPGLAAGLVREDGPERFRFAHALTRDASYASLSATRRARAHAHVARVLEEVGGRETELARHWLAAGPAHAGRAWRAAVTAAHVARSLHGHDESVDLLEAARDAMTDDPAASPRDRYEVLMDLGEAFRWTGRWQELVATAEAAVAVAEDELHDVALAATAAVSTTVGAIWQSAQYGEVHHEIVAALRRSLDLLPDADHPLRCRVMLALANELFYGAGLDEREALAEEALAMARRIGDESLLLDAYQLSCTALWARRTAPRRLAYAEAAMDLAERVGDERSFTIAQVLRTVILGELGRVAQMWESMAEARERGLRLRLPYAQLVLDSQAVPWLAMAGRFDEAEELLADLRRLADQVSLPQTADGIAGAVLVMQLWRGEPEPVLPVLREMALHGPLPSSVNYAQFLLRAGHREEALAWAQDHPPVLDRDDWYAMFFWGSAAEVALGVGDAALGARAYAELAPYAGRVCSAGSGAALGPVDAFLAHAAGVTGEKELAARHADAALELCRTWDVPLAAQWLRDQRDRYGF
jgi:DNA-binding SARP family transcriptional activator